MPQPGSGGARPFLFSGTGFGACGPGRVQGETLAWFWIREKESRWGLTKSGHPFQGWFYLTADSADRAAIREASASRRRSPPGKRIWPPRSAPPTDRRRGRRPGVPARGSGKNRPPGRHAPPARSRRGDRGGRARRHGGRTGGRRVHQSARPHPASRSNRSPVPKADKGGPTRRRSPEARPAVAATGRRCGKRSETKARMICPCPIMPPVGDESGHSLFRRIGSGRRPGRGRAWE